MPEPEREVMFHPTRRWRFDFLWRDQRLAVEVDGGIWIRGRHNTGIGYVRDAEKLNEAMLAGWRVLRVCDQQIRSGEAIEWIRRGLGVEAAPLELSSGKGRVGRRK